MSRQGYQVHGLRLTVSGAPRLLEALHARLGRFEPDHASGPADIHFEFVQHEDAAASPANRPPGRARAILDPGFGEVLYFEQADQLYLEIPAGPRAVADPSSRRVLVAHGALEARELWHLSHFFFTVPFAEMLKRRGYYMVHAAGLALEDRGCLIAGDSGSGKTTLTLALVRAGFGFLGDDTLFLDASARALAFPDMIDVTPQTARFFPELEHRVPEPAPGERRKWPLCATSLYGITPCRQCQPAVLIFPCPSPSPGSVLSPLPKEQALLRLGSNVLRTELKSSQAHLDALAALVARCRCYRLDTGRDFDALPALLRSLLFQEAP